MTRRETVGDAVLEERVRAELGRAVSNPGPIDVTALAGTVTLSGPVVMSELDDLLSAVLGVSGVVNVENRLETYASGDDIPGREDLRSRRSNAERVLDLWEPTKAES